MISITLPKARNRIRKYAVGYERSTNIIPSDKKYDEEIKNCFQIWNSSHFNKGDTKGKTVVYTVYHHLKINFYPVVCYDEKNGT